MALARSRLLLDEDGGVLRPVEENETVLRRIPRSPILLVGLDQEKRARFLGLWRGTFPDRWIGPLSRSSAPATARLSGPLILL